MVALSVGYEMLTLLLVAFGLALVFGLLGVMNMAHGEFVMLGAYCAVFCDRLGLPFWTAIPLAMVVVGLVGLLIERGVISRLYDRPFDTFLATWGLAIIIREVVEISFGKSYQSVPSPIKDIVSFQDAGFPGYRIALMLVVLLAAIALVAYTRRTKTALKVQAMADNPGLAMAMGMDTKNLAKWVFVFSAASAGLAGVLLASQVRISPDMGIAYLLDSFFVIIVGGLGSLAGLAAGSGVIGGVNSIASHAFGQSAGYFAVLVLSICFLWLIPKGLVSRS